MNFTENCKEFMKRWDKGENERSRSYDYCKNLFDKFYQKPTLTKEEKDYFALNLFCYLASWGMLRGKGWLLSRSYKFFIPLCDVLFDKTYADLLNIDPLNGTYDANKVMELYNALYNKIDEMLKKDKMSGKEASKVMLCKIMMGTYGCVIAYDTYDCAGLKQFGMRVSEGSKLEKEILEKTRAIIVDPKNNFQAIMEQVRKKVNYTPFKVLDMILWIEGEKSEKHKS